MTYEPGAGGAPSAAQADFILLDEQLKTSSVSAVEWNLGAAGSSPLSVKDTYDHFVLMFDNVILDASSTVDTPSLRLSTNANPEGNHHAGATDYTWALIYNIASGNRLTTAPSGEADDGDAKIMLAPITNQDWDDGTNRTFSCQIWLFGVQNTTHYTLCQYQCAYMNDGDFLVFVAGGGALLQTGQLTGMEFASDAGQDFTGNFRLYGLSETAGPS